ncbi:MAG: TRAP transporter large permease [Clostridia bacterium]|nr:TRAP transporter large permease [Clostridia bacterium]
MLLLLTAAVFVVLVVLGLPIAFALGVSGVVGLLAGGFPLSKLPSSMLAGAESWVLLAIPSFVFAGAVMERCGMSHQLVNLARSLVGWMRGGLGMTVVGAEYLFSGVSGSSIADVSAIGSMLTPPMVKAGYRPEHAVSIVAAATGMGILIPPAIFMIVIGTVTSTSVVGIFLGGFLPGLVMAVILMAVIYWQAVRHDWPVDARPSLRQILAALRDAAVPIAVPVLILSGFRFGIFTATEAGAIVAFYAVVVALVLYRNVSWREMLTIARESALTTATTVYLLAVATVYQFLMGILRVPELVGRLLGPLHAYPWLFLVAVAVITMFFGMVMEGLPAAVILLPILFPTAQQMGIHPIHFNIVMTAAVGVGLFMPPLGVGLLMALRFANVSVGQHVRYYLPYAAALLVGLLVIILVPDITLWLPRSAGIR